MVRDGDLRARHGARLRAHSATGDPLYTLVNPVDDALMKITRNVLRGEDLLSTPAAIWRCTGARRSASPGGRTDPRYAHLPYVMGKAGNCPGKVTRSPTCFCTSTRGFLPEGLRTTISLLGWGIAIEDRDVFSLERW